jgi:hypothetical protein
MTITLSTRSTCDECGNPAVLTCGDAFLCERCDVRINGEVANSNSDASASRPDDIAAAGHSSPRSPAVATFPDFGMAGFNLDFDAEIARLESEWRRDRIA